MQRKLSLVRSFFLFNRMQSLLIKKSFVLVFASSSAEMAFGTDLMVVHRISEFWFTKEFVPCALYNEKTYLFLGSLSYFLLVADLVRSK